MALTLDGNIHGQTTTSTTQAVTLVTTNDNNLVVVVITVNGGPVISVTSATLTFTQRASATVTGAQRLELWTAPASAALNETITVTQTSSSYIVVDAFSFYGSAAVDIILDTNASNPDTVGGGPGAGHCFISTDTADSAIVSAYRFDSQANPTPGTGFTSISDEHYTLSQYKIVTSTQSSLECLIGTGDGDENAGIAIAFIEDVAAGGGTLLRNPGMSGGARDLTGGMTS